MRKTPFRTLARVSVNVILAERTRGILLNAGHSGVDSSTSEDRRSLCRECEVNARAGAIARNLLAQLGSGQHDSTYIRRHVSLDRSEKIFQACNDLVTRIESAAH